MSDSITITSPDNTTQMTCHPERGGLVSSLKIQTPGHQALQERLFLHDFFDQSEWDDLPGGMPFLFPVCARLSRDGNAGTYLYNGKQYHLKIHGFSWYLPWEVVDQRDDMVTLRLHANEQTLAHYPFKFEILLRYQATTQGLTCHQTYSNRGDYPMPFYAGFHPYFATPPIEDGKADIQVAFEATRRLQYNDTMTDIISSEKPIPLPCSITNPDINEQLHELSENKQLKLTFPDNTELQLEAKGEEPNFFPFVQTYTMADKPFFCLEPWMAFPNALNTVSGAYWLQPGESKTAELHIDQQH